MINKEGSAAVPSEARFVYKNTLPFGPRVLDRNTGRWMGVDLMREMHKAIPRNARGAA